MDIQEVFYYMATIAMSLTILLLLLIGGFLIYIMKKISALDKYGRDVIHKVDTAFEEAKSKFRFVSTIKSSLLGKSSK